MARLILRPARPAGGGGDGERRQHDHAADGDRGDVSEQADDPSLPRQRPVSSRQAGASLAGKAGLPDQAIERLWGLMHKHITHNRCHKTFADFREAILTFLRDEVPRNWHAYCDAVSDNFRVISPKDFRILA